jgi:hypothetical protein
LSYREEEEEEKIYKICSRSAARNIVLCWAVVNARGGEVHKKVSDYQLMDADLRSSLIVPTFLQTTMCFRRSIKCQKERENGIRNPRGPMKGQSHYVSRVEPLNGSRRICRREQITVVEA